MSSFAQNYQNNITVSGSHTYDISPQYTTKMVASLTNVYYDAEITCLDDVTLGYYEKLNKAGISRDQISEDQLHYALLGYEKKGTIVVFKSSSLKDTQTFLEVKAPGITRSDTTLDLEFTDAQLAEYSEAAFKNAKGKASAIAAKIGRKIGKAIYINDTNLNKISESMYYANKKETRAYNISVSFELL